MFYCIVSFFNFISAELIQLLSLVFKMEIFDWSAGLLLDLSINFCPEMLLVLERVFIKIHIYCLK